MLLKYLKENKESFKVSIPCGILITFLYVFMIEKAEHFNGYIISDSWWKLTLFFLASILFSKFLIPEEDNRKNKNDFHER